MLSAIHKYHKIPAEKNDRKTCEIILKSECVIECNKNMGRIGRVDSVLQHYPVFQNTVKCCLLGKSCFYF